jgi:predicted Zn-dependent protease
MQRTLCLLPFLAAVAAAQQPNPSRGVNFYSLEKEIALGGQLAAEFRRNTNSFDSPITQGYVNGLGQRLAAHSGNPAFTYKFALIADDPTVIHEPIAFPGGYIFVPVRLILAAQDEDELAGMLAHSIAHIVARHGTRQATRGEIIKMPTIPLIYMGGWTGYAMRQGTGIAIPLGMLVFQRRLELESDTLAARLLSAAGYDPAALARYIEREQAPDDTQPRRWSALPTRTQRLTAIQATIDSLPPRALEPRPGLEGIQVEIRHLTPSMKPPPSLAK